jgi:hypothetical protein
LVVSLVLRGARGSKKMEVLLNTHGTHYPSGKYDLSNSLPDE